MTDDDSMQSSGQKPADTPVKRTLKQSIWEGSFAATMAGMGDQFFSAFGVFLNATTLEIGLLGSLPQLLGSLGQLLLTRLLLVFKTRKRLVATGVLLQALMLIPIMLVFLSSFSVWFLLLFASLYFVFGMLVNPAWSSWMGDLVEQNERGTYFGRRNSINGTVLFLAMLTAGLILQHFKGNQEALVGFIIIFSIAFIGRLLSFFTILRQYEPPFTPAEKNAEGFLSFIKGATRTNYGMVVLFMASLNGVVAVAGPFFAAYMLNDLHLGYIEFTILSGILLLSKYLFMPLWGKATDKYGTRKVLTLSGFLIPAVSALWFVSTNFYWLLFAQVFGGFAWAGFELASFNFLLDATEPAKRPTYIAYYNVVNGTFVFIGAIAGSVLIKYNTLLFGSLFLTGFLLAIVASSVLRLLVVLFYAPRLKEVRPVEHISYRGLLFDVLSIQPNMGVQQQVTIIDRELLKPLQRRIGEIERSTKELIKPVRQQTQRIVKPIVKPIKPIMQPIERVGEKLGEHIGEPIAEGIAQEMAMVKKAKDFPKQVVVRTMQGIEEVAKEKQVEIVQDAAALEQKVTAEVKKNVRKVKRDVRKMGSNVQKAAKGSLDALKKK